MKKASAPLQGRRPLQAACYHPCSARRHGRDALVADYGADPSPPSRGAPRSAAQLGREFPAGAPGRFQHLRPSLGQARAPALSPSSPLVYGGIIACFPRNGKRERRKKRRDSLYRSVCPSSCPTNANPINPELSVALQPGSYLFSANSYACLTHVNSSSSSSEIEPTTRCVVHLPGYGSVLTATLSELSGYESPKVIIR